MANTKNYDWIIVFFVHEIPMDTTYSNNLIKLIQNTGSGENNLVFLIKDSYQDPGDAHYRFTLNVCKLVFNAGTGNNEFQPIPHLTLDNQDKNCWKKAFEYVFKNYTSKRKLLVTYSHGAGFGINRDTTVIIRPHTSALNCTPISNFDDFEVIHETKRYYFLDKEQIADIVNKHEIQGDDEFLNQVKNGYIEKNETAVCKNLEILWITELAAVLKTCLNGSLLDILMMVNCNMQLFDNGYILKDTVRLQLASEGNFRADGYDYPALLNLLRTQPSIKNEILVNQIKDDFKASYVRQGMQAYLDHTTLFANDMSLYPAALALFNQLVSKLLEDMPRFMPGLVDIRNNQVRNITRDFLPPPGIDLNLQLIDVGLWINLVTSFFKRDFEFTGIKENFEKLLNKITVVKYVGPAIQKLDAASHAKYGFSGISIFYPEDSTAFRNDIVSWCVYFDKFTNSPFRRNSQWSKFLMEYFRRLP